MWEAIRSNRRRSWLLVGTMGLVLVGFGAAVGLALDPERGGPVGAAAAALGWLVLLVVALVGGDGLVLLATGAREVRREDLPRLTNVVEEMTLAAALPRPPRIFVVEDDAPNAFAVGRRPDRSAVAVTSGLLRRLDRDELQGVIAHEIGHISNQDVRFVTLAATMMGSIVMLSDVFLRSLRFGAVGRRSGRGRGGLPLLVLALAASIVAPLAARLLFFACSRRREYLADAQAAVYTRYPDGLASALEKIAASARPAAGVDRALAPLYTVNPLAPAGADDVFSTHPPTAKRVLILRSMGGRAGFVDFEAAYRRVSGPRASAILGARTLGSASSVPARAASPPPEANDGPQRAREVAGLLGRLADFVPIACACGLSIGIPPGFARTEIACPRCGARHSVPRALPEAAAAGEPPAPAPLVFRRRSAGWESFRCACGKTIPLSPAFSAPLVKCSSCRREIRVEPVDARRSS